MTVLGLGGEDRVGQRRGAFLSVNRYLNEVSATQQNSHPECVKPEPKFFTPKESFEMRHYIYKDFAHEASEWLEDKVLFF